MDGFLIAWKDARLLVKAEGVAWAETAASAGRRAGRTAAKAFVSTQAAIGASHTLTARIAMPS
jgi:hypothetical protein